MRNLPFAHCFLSYHNYDGQKKCVIANGGEERLCGKKIKSVGDCKQGHMTISDFERT